MEQYKQAYQQKYNLKQIDEAYNKHLEEMAITTYKKGLNNSILQNKINTHKAEKLKDIVEETELVQKMLVITSSNKINIPETKPVQQIQQQTNTKSQQVICNYCQKPNHSYMQCRTRMGEEDRQRKQQINFQPAYQPQTNYNGRTQYQPLINYNQKIPYQSPQNKTYNPQTPIFRQQYQPNFNKFPQPTNFAPKYCSFCKTTRGHTYDECRNKFFPRRNEMNQPGISTQQNNRQDPYKPPDHRTIEEQMAKMQISTIIPEYLETKNNPENYQGSSPK